MTITPLPSRRFNPEILFWDLAIFLITLARSAVRALPQRLPFDHTALLALLSYLLWTLSGLAAGWLLGFSAIARW